MPRIGVKGLDDIIGPIKVGSAILIEGTPGIGKDIIAYQFLYEGIREGDGCAIVFAGRTIEEILSDFAGYGMKIDRTLLTWIDATEAQLSSGTNVINCNISELFTVGAAIKKFIAAQKGRGARIYFGVLSHALMSNPVQEVYKFFASLIVELKRRGVLALALIEEGMHDPQTVVSIEQLCDYVIDMRAYERDWSIVTALRIKKARARQPPLQYYKFAVTPNGIEVRT